MLTQSKAMASYFEAVADASDQPKLASNWIMGEVSRRVNEAEISIDQAPVAPLQLAAILRHIQNGTISNNAAKQVFNTLWTDFTHPAAVADSIEEAYQSLMVIIEAQGLKQISDTGALEKIVDEVLAANAKSVEEYRSGKEKAFNAIIGQAMKATKGKANPAQLTELLKKKLAAE